MSLPTPGQRPTDRDSTALDTGAASAAVPGGLARCAACGEPTTPSARYCEACGAPLPGTDPGPTGRCPGCAAAPDAVDGDGYCTVCGLRRLGEHDHSEVVVDGGLAGVTDRGLRHRRNEDALALARPGPTSAVVVVCDGVSTTERPDDAARAAADAACSQLVAAVTSATVDLVAATRDAVTAAQRAVVAIPFPAAGAGRAPELGRGGPGGAGDLGPPSCTIVTAAVRDGMATIGWLGDTRAYRLDTDGTVTRLTVDDTWAAAQVAAGALGDSEARADPRAHVITRWLGRDAPDVTPRVVGIRLGVGQRLLVCSDGLWNYADSPGALAALVARLERGRPAVTPADLARSLVDHARDRGGHDNITVVVCSGVAPPAGTSHRGQ